MKNRITTFEQACSADGLDPKTVLPYSDPKTKDEISINAYAMLVIIVRVLNEGWKPDWNNSNEYKYWPYFDMRSSSGFGFSRTDCDGWFADTNVGSRLCFKSSELAEYAATHFLSIYDQYMNL